MARYKRPTLEEFVVSKGCKLEDTPDDMSKVRRHEAPRYEVFPPEGKRFEDGRHTLLCDGAADVREQLNCYKIEDCPADCDCGGE